MKSFNIIIMIAAAIILAGCGNAPQNESIPQFSDITLLAGGHSPKKPDTWTEDRAKAMSTGCSRPSSSGPDTITREAGSTSPYRDAAALPYRSPGWTGSTTGSMKIQVL